jgi:photosystem II stability/assembly factor-like uncharacterized protein
MFRSTDGARSWYRVARPPTLPQSRLYAVVRIVIDPHDPDNVYAARAAGGVITSTDGGRTWRRASNGLTDHHVNTLAIDSRGVLYAGTGAPSTDALGQVFRSTDGARTWHPLDRGLPVVGVTGFAIDSSGRSVFAATEGDGVVELRHG